MVKIRAEDMNTLFTMGYGRTTKEAFQERLRCLSEEIDKGLMIVDIRKEWSKSRNGRWCYYGELSRTVYDVNRCRCNSQPSLANYYGYTKPGFAKYRESLQASIVMNDLLDNIYNTNNCYVLVCAEREPFRANGTTPNCHRVILAEELVKELGDEWEVKHV